MLSDSGKWKQNSRELCNVFNFITRLFYHDFKNTCFKTWENYYCYGTFDFGRGTSMKVYCEMMYKNHAWRGQTTALKETVPSLTIAHGVDVSWCLSLIRDNWFCLYYKIIKLEEESLTLRKFLWKFCLRFNRSSFNVIREVLTAPWSAWLQLNLTKLLIFRFLR